jgi:tetratricopeptide (TPR) repeat protein
VRHWAHRHKVVDTSAKNIEDMRGALQGVVSSVRVAELNANNLCYKEAFTTIIDTSEDWRQKLAELLMKQGDAARERGNVEEAAKLFEKAIAARGPELCADVKAGRDRVIEMRRALLAVRGGGERMGHDDMKEAAWIKMKLAIDLSNRGEYEEAITLYEEARDMSVQVHRILTVLSIVFADVAALSWSAVM